MKFHVSLEIFQVSMLMDVAVVKEVKVFRNGFACICVRVGLAIESCYRQ